MLRVITVKGIVAISNIAEHVACAYVRFTVSNRFVERILANVRARQPGIHRPQRGEFNRNPNPNANPIWRRGTQMVHFLELIRFSRVMRGHMSSE